MIDTSLPFGQRIKQLRISRGWSVQKLADMVGITLAGQSHRESRDVAPNFETVEKYAKAFGIETSDIAPEIQPYRHTTELARRLFYARTSRAMTQREVTKLAGISQNLISNMEASGHMPLFSTMARIARALGMSLDEFVTPDMLEGIEK